MLKVKFQEIMAKAVANQEGHVSSLAHKIQRAVDPLDRAERKRSEKLRKVYNLSSKA